MAVIAAEAHYSASGISTPTTAIHIKVDGMGSVLGAGWRLTNSRV
ncbi:hypothetical protein I546_2717 [Mycobacterium kansasii 732]|nr:hypothetical protein I546_2717 [Mycobacterium kansasii 732]